ncbi:MAG: acyl-CoA synthetase [Azonexus sp.]|jgi:predicted LPLAT superfamily acyltransferase|nr:acyl-CoA synthetase [Azonexus sp.]
MASPNPEKSPEWLQHKERGSFILLRFMCRLSLWLGRPLSRVVLHGVALYFALANSVARQASRDYLRRVLQRPAAWRDVYRHILTFATTIHDRLYLLNDRDDLFDIRTSGDESLRQLHAARRGCLLFGSHLGSFEVLRSIARAQGGINISFAMYAGNASQLNSALAAINPAVVLDIIPIGQLDSILTIHRRLGEGAMVGLLADRAVAADKYLEMPFLGGIARFPSAPFRLAALLKEPVYFMSGLYQGGNRYDAQFELLADGENLAAMAREEAILALAEKYVAALERHCRAAPYNWFNFFDFWKRDEIS